MSDLTINPKILNDQNTVPNEQEPPKVTQAASLSKKTSTTTTPMLEVKQHPLPKPKNSISRIRQASSRFTSGEWTAHFTTPAVLGIAHTPESPAAAAALERAITSLKNPQEKEPNL